MADDKELNNSGFVMPELKKTAQDSAPQSAAPPPAENDIEDDTRTRRTVKLGSLKQENPAGNFPELQPVPKVPEVSTDSGVIADPLGARTADAGNAASIDDTRTRKTLVVKPLAPKDVKPLQPGDLPPSAEVPNVVEDTRTRKTIKLAAMTPGAPAVTPGAVQAPTRASEVDDTVKLQRPTPKMMPGGLGAPTQPGVGVSLPKTAPARAVDPSRQTVKLEQMAEAEALAPGGEPAANEEDTHTRPVAPLNLSKATIRLKPEDLPGGAPAQEAPKAAEAPAQQPQINMVRTAPAPKPSVPPSVEEPVAAVPAAAVAAAVAAAQPEEAPAAAPDVRGKRGPKRVPAGKKVALPSKDEPTTKDEEAARQQAQIQAYMQGAGNQNQASPVYTAVAVVALILMAFCTMVTVMQYINTWEPTWVSQRMDVPLVDGWVNK